MAEIYVKKVKLHNNHKEALIKMKLTENDIEINILILDDSKGKQNKNVEKT